LLEEKPWLKKLNLKQKKPLQLKEKKNNMKFNLLNLEGGKSETIDVSDKIMNLKFNHKLIKYVIDWQLNHQKPRTAKTKQRNEIKGSTKKIYAQKGTGQARHASKKAPLFVGGGQAHGPKGAVYKVKKINKKVRKLALAQTLAKKNTDKQLHIIADVKKEFNKTKNFNKFLLSNKLSNALIVSDKVSEKNFVRSARNIKNIKIISDEGANIYDMLKYTNVIITSTSMKKIENRILDEKN
jgi:large subunit ribosomal protein L4